MVEIQLHDIGLLLLVVAMGIVAVLQMKASHRREDKLHAMITRLYKRIDELEERSKRQ
jgi:hypothetical protein